MAFNQKIFNIAQLLEQHLTQRLPSPATVLEKYDVNSDLYIEVNISQGATPDAIIRFKTFSALGNEQSNPVTGLVQPIYTPHILEIGFDVGAQASGTVTLNAVVATNTVTVNGVVFTAVAAGAVGNQFNVGASDTETAHNLADAINASVTAGVIGVVFASSAAAVVTITAVAIGTAGNAITLAATAVRFTLSGATLTGGTGSNTPATDALKVYVLCDCALTGAELQVYEKAALAVTDLGVVANLKAIFTSAEWKSLDRM